MTEIARKKPCVEEDVSQNKISGVWGGGWEKKSILSNVPGKFSRLGLFRLPCMPVGPPRGKRESRWIAGGTRGQEKTGGTGFVKGIPQVFAFHPWGTVQGREMGGRFVADAGSLNGAGVWALISTLGCFQRTDHGGGWFVAWGTG